VIERRSSAFSDSEIKARDWQPVYGSLVMILLVFFIMLISQSHLGDGGMHRLKKALESGKKRTVIGAVPGMHDPAASLREVMTTAGMNPPVAIERYDGGMKLTFDGNAFFSPGEPQLLPPTKAVLREILLQARKLQCRLDVTVVSGCLVPTEEMASPDWELAIRRASVLHRSLSVEGGLPEERLYTIARGTSCTPGATRIGEGNGKVIVVLQ